MPRVTDEHRAARREQILSAAVVCVAEEGFHKTTMAHVIQRSGLSAGAVYGYFRGKDEIIAAIAEQALTLVTHAVDELVAAGQVPSVWELVGHIAGTAEARAAATGVDLTRVMVAAWAEAVRDERVRAVAAPLVARLRDRVADVVAALQGEGRWDPGADPHLVAQAVVGLVPGFVLQRLIVQDVDAAGYAVAVRGLLEGQREPAGRPAPA
ncbi:TetR/AcrR family transcriptional regulator [Ornithinimicrobium pekingense]|uniref:HTH tetR-type domain-containing protein n=1 Tax=Ornithinimicrobium pekingense TaxID=384677 RepID=A0ABQ2F9V0_9MICO|nr:TetR/AcrR family transcriptional regulator [Ornithinimicrobium pekingense]GGK71617.1 hypothetical protein GCM10011509_20200 [Ornithinimicrobium pekingense]